MSLEEIAERLLRLEERKRELEREIAELEEVGVPAMVRGAVDNQRELIQ